MELPPVSSRRHDLDALRAFAMLLGIALHAALSFAGGPWMVQDTRTSGVFHVLISAVHGFRMPLFFLLSGFFTAMLWRRRGLRALITHRFKRVLLPLVLGTITIVPLMHGIGALAMKSSERGSSGGPPTIWKACSTGDFALLQRLIEEGSDVNAPEPAFGVTPLSLAATFGHAAVVEWLLERGADVNRTNRDGGTALHGAAFLGRAEIAEKLLKAGAESAVINKRGDTALDATLADWGTTQFIAGLIQVKVERQSVLEGRKKIRQLLGADDVEPKPRPLLSVWLFLTMFPLFHHLWFLWFLCWMVAGFTVCAWILQRLGWKQSPRVWVNSPLRYVWLVPLTMIPAWFMGRDMPNFGPDTSSSLLPPLHLLAYYAVFFGFGSLYFDSQDDRGSMGRRWWLTMPLALFVIYPAGLHATYEGVARFRSFAIFLQVIYVWAMSAAMMGLFRRFVSQERGWIRYLSDASYWMYVAHLPLVLLAQLWVRDWPMAPGWKFLIVCGGVFAVLLVSYEYLVRYTWIGALLNGRKQRATTAVQT
ncbi:MAG: acyltransferase family protein [Prosthecobacter sp.]